MRTAILGAVRVRSNNPSDLICAFSKKLLWLDQESIYGELISEALVCYKAIDKNCDSIINRLIESLNSYAPKYCFFGKNPNLDDAYGFWVSAEFEDEFDGMIVYELSEISNNYTGEVVHMTSPMNITLYSCKDGELTQLWSA